VTNRCGDFSNTVVDTSNDFDFWTIQEYAASPKFANGDDRWGHLVGPGVAPEEKRRPDHQ
jgi:hypothetical protein